MDRADPQEAPFSSTPRAGLGPLPGPPPRGSALSRSGECVQEALLRLRAPSSVAALVDETGLHPHTIREHLDALAAEGLVSRQRATPRGRGRPAWLYEAPGREARETPTSEYAGMAAALASVIDRISQSPRQDGIAAGMQWGRRLARGASGSAARVAPQGRSRLLSLLEDMGFAPRTDPAGTVVRLTRCPILDAARMHPEVVCGMHLGVVRGALAEFGEESRGVSLSAFAEPGACRLELDARASGARA